MGRLLFSPPAVGAGDAVLIATDDAGTTPADIVSAGGGPAVTGGVLHASGDGSLPRFLGPAASTATLYALTLDYRGQVAGDPVTLTGVDLDAVAEPTGGSIPVSVNGEAVSDSAVLPLAITHQPTVPPSGIVQPRPPLIGRTFGGTKISTTLTSTTPGGVCAGPDGNLWAAGGTKAWKVTPAGVATSVALAGAIAQGCGAGPDGNVWVADATGSLWKVTPGGVATEYACGVAPNDVKAGPDGNLWVADGSGHVRKVSTAGATLASYSLGADRAPFKICVGPDSNLWVADNNGPVHRVTPAGVVTTFAVGVNMYDICAGPDGNLWATDNSGDGVWKITTEGVGTFFDLDSHFGPSGICAGSGGDIWVADDNGPLWLITTDGVATSFAFGLTNAWICTGADGGLWITDANKIYNAPFTAQTGNLHLTGGGLFIDHLPTVDPTVAGQLWSDAGVLTVSAG